MSNNFITINISDDKSLLEACDILHDARCDLSSLHVDEEKGLWKAIFEREFFEDPDIMTHERKLFIFTKTKFPIVKSELSLTGIKSYDIEDKSQIGIFTFNECQIKDNVATLFFCENMKMIIEFNNKPQGKITDITLLNKKGSMYTMGKWFKEKH